MKLTPEEAHAWCLNRGGKRIYPRWRKDKVGFLLYVEPDAWMEEIHPHYFIGPDGPQPDGTWVAGRKSEGTERNFADLEQALIYAELLNTHREFVELKLRFRSDFDVPGIALTT